MAQMLRPTPPADVREAEAQDVARRLAKEVSGGAAGDRFTRGRYATDASIYQIMPLAVAFPKTEDDIAAALSIARDRQMAVIARGGGTSQNGQPIGRGIVLDFSRFFNEVQHFDAEAREVTLRPGAVLERLNARLRE